MHRQTIQNIKVVILPLDGIIFDLNRYRYNYYKHYCSSKNIILDKKEFYLHLSNMYDMYKGLPLTKDQDAGILNAKIERELSQYLHYKGLEPKEGLLELIEYLHQKNIKIAVISTHRTKDAVEYLKLANIYHKFHFIIGSDTTSFPLPSTHILETITDYFHVEAKETLVVSSFTTLNRAANQLHMNVIFCNDIYKATQEDELTSYKVVNNLFEVLNTLLFDQYEDAQLYSPILGMDDQMNKDELDEIYQKLIDTYSQDQQILDIIEQTYQYHLSLLNEHNIKDASIQIEKPIAHRFTFDDEDYEIIKNNDDKKEVIEEPLEEISSNMSLRTLNSDEEQELASLLQKLKQKEERKKDVDQSEEMKEDNPITEQKPLLEEDDDHHSLLNLFIDFIYMLSLSFLLMFIGIIIYVAFVHQFEQQTGIFGIIAKIYITYSDVINNLVQALWNGLHSLISFIPSYESYCLSLSFFSNEGIQLFHVFIMNTLLIGLCKIVYSHFKEKNNHEDLEEDERI